MLTALVRSSEIVKLKHALYQKSIKYIGLATKGTK